MESILTSSELQFSWDRGKSLLLDLKPLQLKKSESVFLYGPSSCGKSTVLNIIAGVLCPSKGNVQILGQDLFTLNSSQRDQFRGHHMGFIFQQFNLLTYFNAIENVMLPCQFSKIKRSRVLTRSNSLQEEALRLLSELNLDGNKLVQTPVHQLSVGQQQRVAVARALMGCPELIIADEPTSALDANVRHQFIELLFQECKRFGIALLFVSHDSSLAQYFDRSLNFLEWNMAAPQMFVRNEN